MDDGLAKIQLSKRRPLVSRAVEALFPLSHELVPAMSFCNANRAVGAHKLDDLGECRDPKLGRGPFLAVGHGAVVVHTRLGIHLAPPLADAVHLGAVLPTVVGEAALL